MGTLEDIEAAVRSEQHGRALTMLLERWKQTRAVAFADAVDAVARRAPRFEPPKIRTNVEFQKLWLKLADENDPLGVTWLAETLPTKLSRERGSDFLDRLKAIKKHPDPRYTRAIVTMIEDRRDETRWAAEECASVLTVVGDERTRTALDALAALQVEDWTDPFPLPSVKKLDEKTRARLAALFGEAAPPKKKSGDAAGLLAAVYRDPDDLGAREVLADTLQELGDPRGEMIALQLAELRGDATAETTARVDELVKKHQKAWLGPLFPLVYRGRFRGGFLEEMELEGRWKGSEKVWQTLTTDERLSTVKVIVEGKTTGDVLARFYGSKAMRGLEKATLTSKEVALAVRANPPPRLRALDAREVKRGSYEKYLEEYVVPLLESIPTITSVFCSLPGVDVLSRSKAFGRLTELHVQSWDGLDTKQSASLLAKLPKSLTTLSLITDENEDAVALAAKLPAQVTTFSFDERATLTRSKKGTSLRILVRHKVELDPRRHPHGLPAVLALVQKKKLVSQLVITALTDDFDRTLFAPSKWKGVTITETRIHESGLTRAYKLG